MAGEAAEATGLASGRGGEGSAQGLDIARNAGLMICAAAALLHVNFLVRGSVTYDGRTYFTLFDDAMISMRYAKTLAAGGGFTWNPGEIPLEGITNPLWTLWMALMHLVPVPEGFVALLVGLTSSACLIATALAARRLARQLGAEETIALAAMGIVAFYYPLAFWSLRGMETGVLACLMAWGMVLAIEQLEAPAQRRMAMLAGLAATLVWVRQDAMVFVAVLAGFVWIAGDARSRATAKVLALTLVASLAVLTLVRLAYYGVALPNTYYLKVTGVTAGERLQRGIEMLFSEEMRGHLVVSVVVLVLSIPGIAFAARKVRFRMALPLAAFCAQAAYSAYVGGDVWELMGYPNRYIVIAMPGLLVLTMVLLAGLARQLAASADGASAMHLDAAPLARVLLVAMTGLLFVQTSARHVVAAAREGAAYVDYDRAATQVGLCLRQSTTADARIAYTWAGSMPYYADRFGIDLLGKMDAHIARAKPQIAFVPGHNKWDYAYSIDTHKPDLIVQLFRAKPGDHVMIRARGYEPADRAWPCLKNTFLEPADVFVRKR